jgi:hypothetical protein
MRIRNIAKKVANSNYSETLSAPPSIHSSSEARLEAEKGQNVKMFCRGNGTPRPTLKWTRVVSTFLLFVLSLIIAVAKT